MKLLEYIKLKEKEAIKNNLESEAIKYIINTKYYNDYNSFINDYDKELDNDEIIKYNNDLDKYLIDNIPPQYIIGFCYFLGLKIRVNKDVLIPRKETEEVTQKAIEIIDKFDEDLKILDLCTGSGAIAIAIKKYLDNKKMTNSIVYASDISKKALDIAKDNAIINDVNIKFLESDLFNNIKDKFDIIISNPPYIPINSKDIEKIVFDNEPHLALFASDNGLYFYKEIIKESINYLNKDNYLILEIGHNQFNDLNSYIMDIYPKANIECFKDLEGMDRILVIRIEE